MNQKKKIDFYFDFLSPYSYVAWTWVRSKLDDYDWSFCPVSVPSIIAHYDTKGPAQIKPKRNYLFKDLLRYTKLFNVPFTTPAKLPFNSLYALRLALKSVSQSSQAEVIDAIFRAGWEKGLDIGSDDLLKEVLSSANLPTADLFLKMEEKSARVELKNNIESGIAKGVFGVPTFFVDEEMFWGNDSIKYLEMYLMGSDPLDHEKYQEFLNKHQF
ncbi:MAG: DsbA family protein [Bacteriovorax sp.]